MDIQNLFNKIHEIIRNWIDNDQFDELKFSWGKSRRHEIDDPLGRTYLRDNTIIIQYTITEDPTWIIDTARGIIVYYVKDLISDKYSCWNFSTIISLILIPGNLVTLTAKNNFISKWREHSQTPHNYSILSNYFRMYNYLKSYSRANVIEILKTFVFVEYDDRSEKSVERQFNEFMFKNLPTKYSEQHLALINASITHQTLEVKQLADLLNLPENKVYELRNNLTFQLSEFFFISRSRLGLIKLYIHNLNEYQIKRLRLNPYFENIEDMEDKNMDFLKMRIPADKFTEFVDKTTLNAYNQQFYLIIPDSTEHRFSPMQYNFEECIWYSAFEIKTTISTLSEKQILNVSDRTIPHLEIDEIKLLFQILRIRNDKWQNNVHELSKTQTKRTLKSLKKKNTYSTGISWLRPIELPSIAAFVPIYNYKTFNEFTSQHGQVQNGFDLFDVLESKLNSTSTNSNILNSIKIMSLPYCVIEYCLQVKNKQITLGAIIRIASIQEDLDRIVEQFQDLELIGFHKYPPGGIWTIPISEYEDGKWKFSVDDFLTTLVFKEEIKKEA